ncbi:MAG: type II toxin-antitoxin system MqsA family antitoxin [Anaerolineales bacterium]
MICLICRQVDVVDGLTSMPFERGEMRLVVNNVPVRVCPQCGEAFVEECVAVRLLEISEAVSASGELDSVIEYDHPIKLLDRSTSK